MLSITRDLHIQVLCKVTLKLPARYDTLHVVGTQVFTEQLESTMGLCLLRFPSGEEITQCVSSGCPLLRCPFIPVTKIGLEICMGGVGNRHM